ncbi:hypothetical protein Pmar_PMAR027820, partial [Perkinsus marinus ATCC 50983]
LYLVNTSSLAAEVPMPGMAIYGIGKRSRDYVLRLLASEASGNGGDDDGIEDDDDDDNGKHNKHHHHFLNWSPGPMYSPMSDAIFNNCSHPRALESFDSSHTTMVKEHHHGHHVSVEVPINNNNNKDMEEDEDEDEDGEDAN